MIDLINKKGGRGLDCYVESAELLFGSMFENHKYRKALRNVTKTQALGGIYGIGQKKLIDSTVTMLREKFDPAIIEEIGVDQQWSYESLQKFYEMYPVREYMSEKTTELHQKGYIELKFDSSLMNFERRYHIPKDKAYKGANACIQGTEAYIIKHAMKRVDNRLIREGWKSKHVDLLMQVHDELIFEVDNDIDFIKHVDAVLTEEMEDWQTFKVPITCSAKVSNVSWGEVLELKEYEQNNCRKIR
jgi:DNA polymerase I-like protein with 3'-5' exonuclease and polymerase domains